MHVHIERCMWWRSEVHLPSRKPLLHPHHVSVTVHILRMVPELFFIFTLEHELFWHARYLNHFCLAIKLYFDLAALLREVRRLDLFRFKFSA